MTGTSRNTVRKYLRGVNKPVSERQKVRNALEERKSIIQEKLFAAKGNNAIVCRQMKEEHQHDISERRMRRY